MGQIEAELGPGLYDIGNREWEGFIVKQSPVSYLVLCHTRDEAALYGVSCGISYKPIRSGKIPKLGK